MKPQFLVPAATALIGFTLAWIVKPGGTTLAPVVSNTEPATPVKSPRTTAGERPATTVGQRPTEVKAGDFPLADQAEKGPKTTEEAKMLRLAEALGLSVDQQGSIIQLIGDIQATANLDLPAIDDLTARGNAVEEGLRKILTPEQFEKFQEIQIRERDNRTELRAQRMLADAIEFIDLSPEQREEVASRLRQKSKADLQSIPNAATLLFDKSILPTGKKEISADGVLLLAKMGEKVTMGNPEEVRNNLMNRHKQELEDILRCFDGILTPAQMGQYQAALAEKRQTIDRARDAMARKRDEIAAANTAAEPQETETPTIIIEPDDSEADEE